MKRVLLCLGFGAFFSMTNLKAQNFLESVIVEKTHTATQTDYDADVNNSITSPIVVGAVTYRIWIDMAPNIKLAAVYGNNTHALKFQTTTSFYNNDNVSSIPTGNTLGSLSGTAGYDSWVTMGGNSKTTIANFQTTNVVKTPAVITVLGIDNDLTNSFDSYPGVSFSTNSGTYSTLNGEANSQKAYASGQGSNNMILIGQFTTDGTFSYEINIQLTDGNGNEQKFVASDPQSGEYMNSMLVGTVPPLTCVWNGTSWLPQAPTSASNAVINGTYNGVGFSCNDLTISPGKQMTVSSGTLAIGGNFSLLSDATGTASFIDNATVTVAGTTIVQQYLVSGRNWYISSPMSTATSGVIKTPLSNNLYNYDESTHQWVTINDASTSLSVMKGYVARVSTSGAVTFTGTLNTGSKTINATRNGTSDSKRGFNLIGNPYPSSIDMTAATLSNLEPTFWYRTVTNNGTYVFDTYNVTSGEGTNNNLNGAVTQYVAPMQAVWVRTSADGLTGSVTLNNTARTHQSSLLKSDKVANKVIRLVVSNGKNSDETILVFNENASNRYDDYDSRKMSADNKEIPELYTIVDSEKMVINGMKPVDSSVYIPLGFKTLTNGKFSISASEMNGVEGMHLILEDSYLHISHDLSKDSLYSFNSDTTNNSKRFVLHLLKTDGTTTYNSVNQNNVVIYTSENSLIVTINNNPNGSIVLFDILGHEVSNTAITNSQTILDLPTSTGVYFVKVITNNTVETKKIIVD